MSDLEIPLRPEPDKLFFAIERTGWTFADVNRYVSSTCATILRHTALEPSDKVAILMRRPAPFALTLLALMRMRVVSVPLNTRLTASEINWQVKKTDCRLLICESDASALRRELRVKVFQLPVMHHDDPASGFDDYGSLVSDDDFAIIHTSGTSGRPKATVLTYGNIYHSALASALKLEALRSERWLSVLPLYHVGGLSIILRSLIYGTAVEYGPTTPFDVHETNRVLSENPITLVSLVPTMLQRLLDAKTGPWNSRLRLILLGGEAPSAELVERCIADNLPIATSYGLTETASQVATAMPELVYRKPGTVGKPLMFTELRIVNERGEEARANVSGAVLVKGSTVMRGYYNDAEATADSLRDGWLHTGDIGYLDDDGDLFILQRREDLIVSGGENIYPAEVEAALRQHPAVAEIIVFGQPDRQWGQRVAAVTECHHGASLSAAELITFAREHLAAYKIPRQIAFAATLPRTASGKIQRREARKLFNDAISSRP